MKKKIIKRVIIITIVINVVIALVIGGRITYEKTKEEIAKRFPSIYDRHYMLNNNLYLSQEK